MRRSLTPNATSSHNLRPLGRRQRYVCLVPATLTTKQPQPEHLKDWYPYYAGFPSGFVEGALTRHYPLATSVLDPWNGAGTTTAVASFRGISSVGIDINPAVTIIAKARQTPRTIADSLRPIALEVCQAGLRTTPPGRSGDPLAKWMRRPALNEVRKLQHGLHVVLTDSPELQLELAHHPDRSSALLGTLPAFYYAALFATVRDLLSVFRASNPTWLRDPATHRHRITPTAERIHEAFLDRVSYLANRLTLADEASSGKAELRTATILDLDEPDAYDGCLTSPPYATRVDYVRSSLAELSVLGLGEEQIADLRRRTTGTPTVRGRDADSGGELLSDTGEHLVRAIARHPSHGSSNYYAPWMRNYLADLERSLDRISSSVVADGPIGIVVQDSHYKEIRVDLQGIITETMESLGRPNRCREDFRVRHSLARLNPAARQHLANRNNSESLLIFA